MQIFVPSYGWQRECLMDERHPSNLIRVEANTDEDDVTVMLSQVDGGSITVEEVHRHGLAVAIGGQFEMVEGNFAPVIWYQP